MKKIIVSTEVRDFDADGVAEAARQSLPTWDVTVENVESESELENKYTVRLFCANCSYSWFDKFNLGTPVAGALLCPACQCKTGRKA